MVPTFLLITFLSYLIFCFNFGELFKIPMIMYQKLSCFIQLSFQQFQTNPVLWKYWQYRISLQWFELL